MSKAELTTEVNSKLNLDLTKDDLLTVLISEEENKIQAEIDELEEKIKKFDNRRDMSSVIYNQWKDYFFEKLDIKSTKAITVEIRFHSDHKSLLNDYGDYIEYEVYDIRRLEGLKNPARASNKKYHSSARQFKVNKECKSITIIQSKDYKSKDGFEGTIHKSKIVSLTKTHMKEVNKIVNEYNDSLQEYVNNKVKLSELQYKLLTLDTDKNIKAAFIKKIVNTSDYTSLLLESK